MQGSVVAAFCCCTSGGRSLYLGSRLLHGTEGADVADYA
jgi:hypothetical protein